MARSKINIFVTGTDTDVGKTVVSAALIKSLSEAGKDPFYYKPIQTGSILINGMQLSEDVEFVNFLAGTSFLAEDSCSYLLSEPMSPYQAAKKECKNININKVLEDYKNVTSNYKNVVVEGAGGLMVPITEKVMMVDLIQMMNIPVVIATRPGLGTINHTLLTVNELKSRKIEIIGFVISGYPENPDAIVKENPEMIEKFCGIKYLGYIGYYENKEKLADNLISKIFI